MKKYQFQIVRYTHDKLTGEFVNVGIIIFQPDSSLLKSRFINKYSRISGFFHKVNGQALLTCLRYFQSEIEILSKRLTKRDMFTSFESLESITNEITPKDDSALFCSELQYGIDLNFDSALDDLFDRLVDKYNTDQDSQMHDDKYVWRKVYKRYFDKYGITSKLKSHVVHTAHDSIEFDKAWKNGAWNCFQTLSFDLKRKDAIKNKVYKWSGIIKELEKTNEKLNLHFLTVNPKNDKNLQKFIEDSLSETKKKINVSIIKEKEADKFAKRLIEEIQAHEAGD